MYRLTVVVRNMMRAGTGLSQADMELLSATQEALHFAKLPKEWRSEERLATQLGKLLGKKFPKEKVFLQRSRLGAYTGQGVAKLSASESPGLASLKAAFPEEVTLRPFDFQDTRNFLDQSRRLQEFTEDLRKLADQPVVTISGIPNTYGPEDLKEVLKEKVPNVEIRDVVFPFDRRGVQQPTAFVATATEADVAKIVSGIGEEFPVPVRRVYGVNFGTALLTASRETLFVNSTRFPEHMLMGTRFWVMSMGWRKETSEAEFLTEMHKLRIFPEEVSKVEMGEAGNFLMKFPRMHDVKKAFTKLHRLALAKKIPRRVVSYAYPVVADFRCLGDPTNHGRHYEDDDLDEPIEY